MEKVLHKTLRAVLALVAAVAALATGTITAHADSGPGLVHGYYVSPISMGPHFINSRGAAVGIAAMDGGNPVYCIQFGEVSPRTRRWALKQDGLNPFTRVDFRSRTLSFRGN